MSGGERGCIYRSPLMLVAVVPFVDTLCFITSTNAVGDARNLREIRAKKLLWLAVRSLCVFTVLMF